MKISVPWHFVKFEYFKVTNLRIQTDDWHIVKVDKILLILWLSINSLSQFPTNIILPPEFPKNTFPFISSSHYM